MVKKIPLQNGMSAIVDDEDYERCVEYRWHAAKNSRNTIDVRGNSVEGMQISLGRFIMRVQKENEYVVNIKKVGNDFRKSNLKVVSNKDAINIGKRSQVNSTSKYRGVTWNKSAKKWVAKVKLRYLGIFEDEDEAAKTWNIAAAEEWGDLAFQNIIGIDNRISIKQLETDRNAQKRLKKIKTSEYRGVFVQGGRYLTSIPDGGKSLYLGTFESETKAAEAYDKKAIELHGDKAILNFPYEVQS